MSFSSGLQFRVIDGQKEKDRLIRLDGKELVLGRAQKGQRPSFGEVLFREPTVSRVHANLSWKERKKGFQLTHKSSTNPTLVNGKPAKKIMLAPGDRIQMGLLILVLEQVPARALATSIGQSGERSRASMTEPILEALSKVERQEEEDRRRAKAENEQKQRQRELMANASPGVEPQIQPNSRSKRLDEALRSSGVGPSEARTPKISSSGFGWQPPEERVSQIVSSETVQTPPLREHKAASFETQRHMAQPRPEEKKSPEYNQPSTTRRRDAVFELVVVKGPDQGRRFPLKDTIMILGQRQGDQDEREGKGVLLNDPTLPSELGMFVWQGREDSYGLLATENSMQIIEVDRISDGVRRRIRVDNESSLLLRVADEIQIGLTTLRIQKIGEPIIARKVRTTPEQEGSSTVYQRSEPSPSQTSSASFNTSPVEQAHFQPPRQPKALRPTEHSWAKTAVEPQAAEATQPVNVDPSHDETKKVTPLWAQATLTPGRESSSPTPPSPNAPTNKPSSPSRGEQSFLEWGTRPKVDFLFEFTEGPMRGCQVSINRQDIARARRYNAGTLGGRENDLVLEGASIANSAFQLIGEEGRFSLYSESPSGLVSVNRSPIKQGDRLVLVTGDIITIDDTQLRFLEREVVTALSRYALQADSGVTGDQDRIFGLNRQRLLIGRGKNCDIRLSDLEVSRVHLGLTYGEGRFSIQHRSETNPTFLNGLSLIPGAVRTLKVGDRIRLSSLTVLRFIEH